MLPPNDDGSTDAVALPFTLNFFGNSYGSLYVNNNGNVTFNGRMSTYTPFPIVSTGTPLIAPYFGDVDTRGAGSGVVTYGATTFGGNDAFCVMWDGVGVGYYPAGIDKLNKFQLLLVNRPDRGAGDFDIVFNYDQIQWEAGSASGGSGGLGGSSARIGFSNGSTASFELPGSAVNGAFLDSNAVTGLIYNNINAPTVPGRYVFRVENGVAPTGHAISGHVW
ncbi:MAG TPA: nidogen-like domain-containing protein, partial [Gaiellaceae bacterium]